MNKYTNVSVVNNKIAFRGIQDGQRIKKLIPYAPSLFIPSLSNKPTKWKTFVPPKEKNKPCDTIYVVKQNFRSMSEARKFIKEYEDFAHYSIYGSTRYQYCYIADNYPVTDDFDKSNIVTAFIDIEVNSDSGFPNPEDAFAPITAITVYLTNSKKYYVFGCHEYNNTRDDVRYCLCENENVLLEKFLNFWEQCMPDVVSGWNSTFFDIPYLHNRIKKILSPDDALRLSPWKKISTRNIRMQQKDYTAINIIGLDGLDYLDLYKKFAYASVENYKLNTIASIELGEKKLDYSEYGNLLSLYKTNYQKFIDYNIQDVELLIKLEEKMKLLEMAIMIAYRSKVNFEDVFAQVTMWDALILNHFKKHNLVVPMKKEVEESEEKFRGAYVKQPIPNLYNWVVSYDLDSLYPNIIIQFNISPDTIIHFPEKHMNIELRDLSIVDSDYLKQNKLTICGNSQQFSVAKQGFLPAIIEPMYEKRKESKQAVNKYDQILEDIKKEIDKRGLTI